MLKVSELSIETACGYNKRFKRTRLGFETLITKTRLAA